MHTRLHHIGHLVGDLAASGRHYQERLGYEPESDVIEDPVQTAFVQFFRLPGALHWIELISPNSLESKLSAALRKGESLHHLCYEVDDIEAAGERLRKGGMLALGRPTPAVAFGGRRIAWFADRAKSLIELVESGPGPLCAARLSSEILTNHTP